MQKLLYPIRKSSLSLLLGKYPHTLRRQVTISLSLKFSFLHKLVNSEDTSYACSEQSSCSLDWYITHMPSFKHGLSVLKCILTDNIQTYQEMVHTAAIKQ